MSIHLTPYLGFDGAAREAMERYQVIFGGELEISTFGEFGDAAGPGADGVMHAQLISPDGLRLMASDTPPGEEYHPGGPHSVSLFGDNAEPMRAWFEQLAVDGRVVMALEPQMWGDEFGQCVDRFGVSWMVNISAPA